MTDRAAALERFFDEVSALSDSQLAGVLPLVVVMFFGKDVPAQLQGEADYLIKELAWKDGATADDKARSTDAYLKKHGVEPAVWRRLSAAFHEDPETIRGAAGKLIGAGGNGALERKAPPPAGTVAGGPFARFGANKLK